MVEKQCSGCTNQIEQSRIRQRYCKSCHNKWMRENRKVHKELNEEQKKKANARSYLNTYVSRGIILKESCSKCTNPIAEAHHEDYNKPLDVIWLCRDCHLLHHRT